MSDGMAFLTGAAVAGVAVLFMMRGGAVNLGATNLPSSPQPLSPVNPVNPYMTTSPTPNPALPGSAVGADLQKADAERLRAMFEQQRVETEQLKAQVQNQQLVIEKLTAQGDQNNSLFARNKAAAAAANQQQENPMLSGLVWALGGMAITISGGVVVVGALSVLSRQQRPPRTTYVVQQPYPALPHSLQARRRTEVMPPPMDERQVDYVEYDR